MAAVRLPEATACLPQATKTPLDPVEAGGRRLSLEGSPGSPRILPEPMKNATQAAGPGGVGLDRRVSGRQVAEGAISAFARLYASVTTLTGSGWTSGETSRNTGFMSS
jgi:hypothetical protein